LNHKRLRCPRTVPTAGTSIDSCSGGDETGGLAGPLARRPPAPPSGFAIDDGIVVPLREKQPRSSQQATREVLQFAQRTFGESIEERAAINEEAVPDNEEFQSTNEGLLISKEDLQSLNEGLSALNSQLKEALKRQCTTSDDLQNILNSSNIALLFLDPLFYASGAIPVECDSGRHRLPPRGPAFASSGQRARRRCPNSVARRRFDGARIRNA
jgi:hypothetical protein